MKFFTRFRLETYLLIFLSAAQIVFFAVFKPQLFFFGSWQETLKALLFYFFFGGHFLIFAFAFFHLYFLARFLFVSANRFFERAGNSKSAPIFKSLTYLTFATGLVMFADALHIGNLLGASKEKIIYGSNLVMNLDKAVFGFYPAFAGFWNAEASLPEWLEKLLVNSYLWMGILLPILFLVLAFLNKELFRKYILVFALTVTISNPIWYSLPAISPHFMYRYNVLQAEAPREITQAVKEYKYSGVLLDYQEDIAETKRKIYNSFSGATEDFYPLTTFPSMHAAWGTMIAYFAVRLWTPLIIVVLPWWLLNMAGAVYTQWHYASDMLSGALIAALVIIAVNYIFRLERKKTDQNHLVFLDVLKGDLKKLREFSKKGITTLVSFRGKRGESL